MLASTLQRFMREPIPGVRVEPIEDNAFEWRVRMHRFPAECGLYEDMVRLDSLYGQSQPPNV
jgi:hypothetical protein